MKKLATIFSWICVLNVLMIAGLAAFLFGTGRLDKGKAQAIADMLKHEGAPADLREKVYDILQPAPATLPATAPASRPGERPALAVATDMPMTSEQRLDYVAQALEQGRLKLERDAQALRGERKLLEELKLDVDNQLKLLALQKKDFEAAVAAAGAKGDDGTLQKMLALYDEMKPKQIKDIFTGMTPEAAAKYIEAMSPERAAKIFAEFKTAEEKDFMTKILERMRGAGTGAASASQPVRPAAISAATPAP